jgi:hypothetical protein
MNYRGIHQLSTCTGRRMCCSATQRGALAAVGGRVDSPSKREKLKAREISKKRGAYPPSAARIVGWRCYSTSCPSGPITL